MTSDKQQMTSDRGQMDKIPNTEFPAPKDERCSIIMQLHLSTKNIARDDVTQ